MAQTLGQQLDAVQTAISAVETSQSYEMDGRKLTRADLSTLYKREDSLISKIEIFGRDYAPGQNTSPMKTRANVRFS
ncbi:MAG: hypothetical protein V2A75_07915 [Pseudomonadota bacterium]